MVGYSERNGSAREIGIAQRNAPTTNVRGRRFLSRPVAGLSGWHEVICETKGEGMTLTQRVAVFETEQDAEGLARFLATRGEAAS